MTVTRDSIDDLLAELDAAGAQIDLDVEGIVDRISTINKRVRGALKETLSDYGITPEDWHVLTTLRLRKGSRPVTPGALARGLDLSSGATTSRLDRLEDAGYIRRLPDPSDRRGVLVELTDEGRAVWEEAIEVQGRKEAFFASALTKREQQQLNALLRKLVIAFSARASQAPSERSAPAERR